MTPHIEGDLIYDGEVWFVDDPAVIEVSVTDMDGEPLNGNIKAGFIDRNGTVVNTVQGSTGTDGEVSLSTSISEPGIYRVDVVFNSDEGVATIGSFEVVGQSPVLSQSGSGTLVYSKNTISTTIF